jgi:PadR family transcriptional regulator, regulatory protein PadR
MYYICNMDLERNNAQMRKGVLELCILSIVSREDAYASDIIEKLKEAKLIVVEGTLYPLLTRLKNEGLLSYRWEESTQGPPRKYYKITEAGQKSLDDMVMDWKELVVAVERLLESTPTPVSPPIIGGGD